MDKFFIWVGRNRKVLGYSIGSLAVLSGCANLITGDITNGIVSSFIGLVVLIDTGFSI